MYHPSPNVNPMTVRPLLEKPSLETVKSAIKTVVSQDSNVDRVSATEFIESLKYSVHAWEICNQLLVANESVEISYLAAHMLRTKISKHFADLPPEYHDPLKDSLLTHLQTHEDYGVQGQLTTALADLTLLLCTWENPIEDIANKLSLEVSLLTLNDHAALYKALSNRLIFASVINHMCDLNHSSQRPYRIGSKRREEFEDYLISKCNQAITWWLGTLKEMDELKVRLNLNAGTNSETQPEAIANIAKMINKLVGQIYLCYSAWLRIFDEENVNLSLPLIDSAFKDLEDLNADDKVHRYAVEVVISTASYCEDNRRVDYLVGHLINKIYLLNTCLQQAIAREDLEKSSNFISAISVVAETACPRHVIANKEFNLIDLMLSCLNQYDFEMIEETYAFWWKLLEEMQNRLQPRDYQPFLPYVDRFILTVTKLCEFDPDEESVVSEEEEIHRFRKNTTELITNLMFVTDVGTFLNGNHVLDIFSQDISALQWEKIEAVIHLLYSLAQVSVGTHDRLNWEIIKMIARQQTKTANFEALAQQEAINIVVGLSAGEVHPQLAASTINLFAQYSSGFMSDGPILSFIVKYMFGFLNTHQYRKQLMDYTASGLRTLLKDRYSRCYFAEKRDFVATLRDLCADLDQFNEFAVTELVSSTIMVFDCLPRDMKDPYICAIFAHLFESLRKALASENQDTASVHKHLDRLSTVFSRWQSTKIHLEVDFPNLLHMVDTVLWPLIVKTLEVGSTTSSNKAVTIEKACRTIRYLVRCLVPRRLVPKIAETMINLYKVYPQNSSPVYVCSILVDQFGQVQELMPGLFNMLEVVCQLTFSLLNDNNSGSSVSLLTMKTYPETIDDMMRLFMRFLKKAPREFLKCNSLESIIELALASLRLDHPDANASVCKFLSALLKQSLCYGPSNPQITRAVKSVLGQRILDASIRACAFDLPSSLLPEHSEMLMNLRNVDYDLFPRWVDSTFSTLPTTNVQGIESVSTEQIEKIKKDLKCATRDEFMIEFLRTLNRLYA